MLSRMLERSIMSLVKIALSVIALLLIVANVALANEQRTSAKPTAENVLYIDGSTGVKPLIEALVDEFVNEHSGNQIRIGTGLKPKDRLKALGDKTIDIAMASHGIDINTIREDGFVVHSIARVAVVIGVHQSVDIHRITSKQLCDVYAGRISNWRELGGASIPIITFMRPVDEVDAELLIAELPCIAKYVDTEHVRIANKSGDMARLLSETDGSIGITTMVRVVQSDDKIKPIVVEELSALSRNMYLITRAEPDASTLRFLAFIQSGQGADIIRRNHAIPIDE